MWKSFLNCAVALALVFIVGQPAWAQSTRPAAAPATAANADFVSNEGGFRVRFPGTPKTSVSQQTLPTGPAPYYQFVLTKGGVVYLVSYVDYPRAFNSPKTIKVFYDTSRDNSISGAAKLVTEKSVKADGVEGREFITEDGDSRLATRQFLVGRRLYQLIIGVTIKPGSPGLTPERVAQASAFLDSFHLLQKPADQTAYASETGDQTVATDGVRGSVEGHIYRNDVLAITMILPDGWHVIDDKQFEFANTRGSRSAAKSGLDDSIDRSLKNTANLIAVSKYSLGTSRNATMVMSTELLSDPKATPAAIAAGAMNVMKAALPLRVTKEISSIRVGGVDFAMFTAAVDLPDGVFRQSYYVTNRRGQALTVVFSYVFDDDATVMERSLLSLRFALMGGN